MVYKAITSSPEKLEQHEKFEELLLDISANIVSAPASLLDDSIEEAQYKICDNLGVDYSVIWQFSRENPQHLTITHYFSFPGSPPIPASIDGEASHPYLYRKLMEGNVMAFSTEELPEEAEIDKQTRRKLGAKSSVAIPLFEGGDNVFGIMSFDSLTMERTWSEREVSRLRLVATIFANAIKRKEFELDLLETNSKLTLAAESAGIGLWEMDYQTGHVWVTPRVCEIFEFERCERIELGDFKRMIHPSDWIRISKSMEGSFVSKREFREEYRLADSGSGSRWVTSVGKPYFNGDGSPNKLIGVSVDVTERKEMELTIGNQLSELTRLKEQIEQENIYLREELLFEQGFTDIVGKSEPLKAVLNSAKQVADTPATVLLLGETGTGKGLVANLIHRLSDRCTKPFVVVNCATLPPNLIESELFGRTKGAFTGADAKQMGRFEVANNGTIFLDEVGELQLDMQAKLLRVLQDGEFERLGSSTTIKVDTRIIAATGRDLRKEVEEGRFREDLYYRLNVFPLTLPPLRARTDDIELLAKYFIRKYSQKMRKEIESISKHTLTQLENYSWPGNVRELEHLVERSVILSTGDSLSVNFDFLRDEQVPSGNGKRRDLISNERDHILEILKQTNWKIEGRDGAASILDVHPSTLRFKLKKLGLKRPGKMA